MDPLTTSTPKESFIMDNHIKAQPCMCGLLRSNPGNSSFFPNHYLYFYDPIHDAEIDSFSKSYSLLPDYNFSYFISRFKPFLRAENSTYYLNRDILKENLIVKFVLHKYCHEFLFPKNGDDKYTAEFKLLNYIFAFICLLGLIGNFGNFFILSFHSKKYGMGRMERSVYWGLVSLAASDILFCLTSVPRFFITGNNSSSLNSISFPLFYNTYVVAFTGLFAIISTWITVAMAVGRYFAICKPFVARALLGRTAAKRTLLFIFVACFFINLPRFFHYKIVEIRCYGYIGSLYMRWPLVTPFSAENSMLTKGFMYWYFSIGIFLPFLLLAFSSFFLIKTLGKARTTLKYCGFNQPLLICTSKQPFTLNSKKLTNQQRTIYNFSSNFQQPQSARQQRNQRLQRLERSRLTYHSFKDKKTQQKKIEIEIEDSSNKSNISKNFVSLTKSNLNPLSTLNTSTKPKSDPYRTITLTLIVLVVAYIVLVTPSELYIFVRFCFLSNRKNVEIYNLIASIANTLQATNYSLNFLIYYAINVNFRRSFSKTFECRNNSSSSDCFAFFFKNLKSESSSKRKKKNGSNNEDNDISNSKRSTTKHEESRQSSNKDCNQIDSPKKTFHHST